MTRVDVLAAVSRNDIDTNVVDQRYLCALLLRKRNGLPSNRPNGIATFKSPNRPGSVRDVETTRSDLVSFVESLIDKTVK